MKQSRSMSLLETGISTAFGFAISLLAQWLFLPLVFGVTVRLDQNVAFALIMTVVSLLRQYGLRRLFEALHIRTPLSASLLAIAAERRRQIEAEGWIPEHDDGHATGELAKAAACYALQPDMREQTGAAAASPLLWPWSRDWWKPVDNRRDLVRAGALIVAELDKADRARKRGRS